ncbi:hypothetical protein INR49_016678, partial [Caranx melampygus]
HGSHLADSEGSAQRQQSGSSGDRPADEWVQGKWGDSADRKGMTVVASLYSTARGGKEKTRSPNTEADSLTRATFYLCLCSLFLSC